jgi:hypothetical protein
MQLTHQGTGDVEKIHQYLKPDSVAFIVIRIMHAFGYLVELGDAHKKPYYGLVLWKGNKVSLLEKAMVGHHFNAFSKMIEKYMGKLRLSLQGTHHQAETLSELNEDRLKRTFRLFEGDELKE